MYTPIIFLLLWEGSDYRSISRSEVIQVLNAITLELQSTFDAKVTFEKDVKQNAPKFHVHGKRKTKGTLERRPQKCLTETPLHAMFAMAYYERNAQATSAKFFELKPLTQHVG